MTDIINHISTEMRLGPIPPHKCAEYRSRLAGEYAFVTGQLEAILSRKPAVWNKKRLEFKSDKACDRWWEASEDGINETGLRLREKSITKLMTGLKALQDLAEGQARNQYEAYEQEIQTYP